MTSTAPRSIVILTGAGVSADSGVATFRGPGGLWEGHRIEDVATPQAWRRDPATVRRFYQLRRAALRDVEPNAAHRAIAAFEARCAAARVPFLLVTQNVDDLHERAGSKPLHMHGELLKLRCERCEIVVHDATSLDPDHDLPCSACGFERLRVDVVWFGEMPFRMDEIAGRLRSCTHFAAVGTSGVVYPAAGFLAEARASGAKTFVQSLDPPDNLDPRDDFRPGRAALVVPALLEDLAADVLV